MNKKRFLYFILVFLLFLSPVSIMAAAPAHTYTTYKFLDGNRHMYMIEISWQADDTDASIANFTIPTSTLEQYKGTFIYRVITDPGTTAPTAAYDIVINDIYGADIMSGSLADRSATATEFVEVTIPVYGQLTGVFTNNSVNSATGKVILIFVW